MKAVKILIDASLIEKILTTGYTIGNEDIVRIRKGLPINSKLVSVHWYDMYPHTIELVFTNETFEDLKAVPHLDIVVEQYRKGLFDEQETI